MLIRPKWILLSIPPGMLTLIMLLNLIPARRVGTMTSGDFQTITNLVRSSEPNETIKSILPRDRAVVVNTDGHCYYFERTRKAWKITLKDN